MGFFSRSPAQPPHPSSTPTADSTPLPPPTPSQNLPESQSPKSAISTPRSEDVEIPRASLLTPRKPLVMFFAGAAFLALSTVVTKRAVLRRWSIARPKYYQPNTNPNKVKGMYEALEALHLATLNVMGGAIMFTGGTLWALQISNIDQLRARFKVVTGYEKGSEGAGLESTEQKESTTEKTSGPSTPSKA